MKWFFRLTTGIIIICLSFAVLCVLSTVFHWRFIPASAEEWGHLWDMGLAVVIAPDCITGEEWVSLPIDYGVSGGYENFSRTDTCGFPIIKRWMPYIEEEWQAHIGRDMSPPLPDIAMTALGAAGIVYDEEKWRQRLVDMGAIQITTISRVSDSAMATRHADTMTVWTNPPLSLGDSQ
jgi:hypothetical protein